MAIRKIDLMHRLFGKAEGHTCRECNNIVKEEYHGRTYTKCKVYGQTMSAASDWVQRYQACGMFNKPWRDKPIIRMVRPSRKEREEQESAQIEGQMSIAEY